ncbi:NAD-dependent epimerase/dehydratase family protein [Saccharopolyspora rhizosphaerae]|uniref:NAD-dependent epimerase/dehydratase family protein n=1 Tax=Saccharopolyspora rhizosphaerae TaxID=2492662 RepID=A0A3R8VM67_9PSEU|nr:NAD(P)H-binding protein [Saccharopolyspora rhizosphaerae]RRO20526.1 NAD-dependent epimerase/dehydratase family protein [Saccharopolyspora rhizosphaerae]
MSTIAIIGGTGFTGSNIVRHATSRGHQVTSLSRSHPREPLEGVQYLTGSVEDRASELTRGSDVLIAALAPRGDMAGQLVRIYGHLAEHARTAGARFLVIGGFSSLRPDVDQPRFVEDPELPASFADEAREMEQVRQLLVGTPGDLDWLFVSPAAGYGSWAEGAHNAHGTYRLGGEVALTDEHGESHISGPDFALAIVDEIDTPVHHRAHLSVAY